MAITIKQPTHLRPSQIALKFLGTERPTLAAVDAKLALWEGTLPSAVDELQYLRATLEASPRSYSQEAMAHFAAAQAGSNLFGETSLTTATLREAGAKTSITGASRSALNNVEIKPGEVNVLAFKGDASSGKITSALELADALGRPSQVIDLGSIHTQADLAAQFSEGGHARVVNDGVLVFNDINHTSQGMQIAIADKLGQMIKAGEVTVPSAEGIATKYVNPLVIMGTDAKFSTPVLDQLQMVPFPPRDGRVPLREAVATSNLSPSIKEQLAGISLAPNETSVLEFQGPATLAKASTARELADAFGEQAVVINADSFRTEADVALLFNAFSPALKDPTQPLPVKGGVLVFDELRVPDRQAVAALVEQIAASDRGSVVMRQGDRLIRYIDPIVIFTDPLSALGVPRGGLRKHEPITIASSTPREAVLSELTHYQRLFSGVYPDKTVTFGPHVVEALTALSTAMPTTDIGRFLSGVRLMDPHADHDRYEVNVDPKVLEQMSLRKTAPENLLVLQPVAT